MSNVNIPPPFDSLFILPQQGVPLAPVTYDPWLVTLSVLVAIFSAIAALWANDLARDPKPYPASLAPAAHLFSVILLGSGVWLMHFIGMLAVDVCQPVRYDPLPTLLSMLPAYLAAHIGLRRLAASDRPSGRAIIASGAAVGAGIGAMHYSGMAGMQTAGYIRYDPLGFLISLLVAVALSIAALALRHATVLRVRRLWSRRMLAGTILGSAITAMHYTAMAATRFVGEYDIAWQPDFAHLYALVLIILAVALLIYGLFGGLFAIYGWRAIARQARAEARMHQTLLDSLPFAIVSLRLRGDQIERLWASQALETVTGLDRDRYLAGEGSLLDFVSESQRRQLLAEIKTASLRRESWRRILSVEIPGRGTRLIELRIIVAGVSSDHCLRLDLIIDDRTETELRNARLQALVSAIDRLMLRGRFAPDGTIIEINDNLARTLGYPAAALTGRNHRLLWPDSQQVAERFWVELAQGHTQSGTFTRRAADGSLRYLQGWYQPLTGPYGAVTEVLKLAVDVTPLVTMQQQLSEAKASLEAMIESRQQFFANVSHEIRTPLNAILGFSQLLAEEISGPAREKIVAIQSAGRTLLHILNDLLDAAKLERGDFSLTPGPFRLDRLLQELASEYGLLAGQKGLDFRLELPAGLPTCWHGDALRLRQCLTNLLNNAIKFTERGIICLAARLREDGWLVLSVQDSGPGIPPEQQSRVFEPFTQTETSIARRHGGTGLGLTIVRDLVRLMGGEITLDSRVGVGSTFTLNLPLTWQVDAPCPETASDASSSPAALGLRLLAADDVELNRALLAQLAQRLGCTAEIHPSGNALLARYIEAPAAWDVVLLDLQMGDGDGLSTARAIRAHEQAHQLPAAPIYALTARTVGDVAAQVREAGFDGLLTKPLMLSEFDALMRNLAQRALSAAASPSPLIMHPLAVSAPVQPTASQLPGEPPMFDARQAAALWGEQWGARARAWLTGFAATQDEWPRWLAADWHKVAGAAANLALPRLATALRSFEGKPPSAPELQTLASLVADLLAVLPSATAASEPTASGADEGAGLPRPSAEQVEPLLACLRRSEIPEDLLARLASAYPVFMQRVQAALDRFDFAAAIHLLEKSP